MRKQNKIDKNKNELYNPKENNEVLMMGRKIYEEIKMTVICFEEADIITYSENDYDNIGGWNPGWEFDWMNMSGDSGQS